MFQGRNVDQNFPLEKEDGVGLVGVEVGGIEIGGVEVGGVGVGEEDWSLEKLHQMWLGFECFGDNIGDCGDN
jgi:hypothetical protein